LYCTNHDRQKTCIIHVDLEPHSLRSSGNFREKTQHFQNPNKGGMYCPSILFHITTFKYGLVSLIVWSHILSPTSRFSKAQLNRIPQVTIHFLRTGRTQPQPQGWRGNPTPPITARGRGTTTASRRFDEGRTPRRTRSS